MLMVVIWEAGPRIIISFTDAYDCYIRAYSTVDAEHY